MKVIIPLAGKGTRLRPHTHLVPKPMLKIAGKPVMAYILEDLERLGRGDHAPPALLPAVLPGLAVVDEHPGLGFGEVSPDRLGRRREALVVGVDQRPGDQRGTAPVDRAGGQLAVEGVHPDDISKFLDLHGIAIRAGHHCAMPLHHRLGISASSRASFYFYNTPAEVERLAAAVRDAQRVLKR